MDFSGLSAEQREVMERRRSARMHTREEAATLQASLDQLRDELEFAQRQRDEAMESLEIAEGNVQKAAEFGSQLLHQNQELEELRDSLEKERDDLLSELEQSKEKTETLMQTTRTLTLEKGRLAEVVESLEHESTLDQSAIEDLKQQHETRASNFGAEAKQMASLLEQVDDHREELEEAAARYAKLEAKNTALQEQLSAVGGGAEDLHLEIKALKREMQDAQDIADEQKAELEAQLVEAHDAYVELEKKGKGIRDTLMNRFADAQAKHEEEKERLTEHVEELKRDIEEVHRREGSVGSEAGFNTSLGVELGSIASNHELATELDEKRKEVSTMSDKVRVLTERQTALEKELAIAKQAAEDSQSKAEDTRADLMSQLEAMAIQLKDADEAQGEQLRSTQALHAEKRALREELDAATDQKSHLEAKLAALTRDLDESRASDSATMTKLRIVEEAGVKAAECAERALEEKAVRIAQLEKELEDLKNAAEKAAARHAEKMAGLEAGRVTLKQQVEKLQNTITDFKADSHAAEKDHATKLRETIESLHEAQSSLTSARQSAAEAETALQTSQSELTAARAEIIHLQDALAELKSSDALHKSQLAELGGARDEARSKTEEARTLALELDEIRKAAAAAEAQRAKLQASLADESAEKTRLEAALADERSRHATATASLKEAKQGRSKAETEAEHARVQVDALNAQIASLQQGQQRSTSEAESELQKLNGEIRGLRDTIVEQDALLRETTTGYDEVVAELEVELRNREDRIAAIERELQKVLAKAQDLESESQRDEATDKEMRDKLIKMEKEKFAAQDELAAKRNELDELKVIVAAATREHDRLRQRLEEMETKLQKVQEDRDRKQAEIRSGTKALSELTSKEEALHDEIDELKILLEEMTGKCEDLEDDLDDKEKDHAEAIEVMQIEHDAVIDVLKTEIETVSANAEKFKFEKDRLASENEKLKAKMSKDAEAAKEQIDTQRTELNRLTSELKTSLAACAEANDSLARTIEKLSAKSEQCDALQKSVDASSGMSAEAAAELKNAAARHRAEMEALTTRCSQLKADNEETSRRALKAETDLAAGKRIYDELQTARSELAAELDAVKEKFEAIKGENETLFGEVNDLMVLNSDLAREQMDQKDTFDAKEADWELQKTNLESEVASLKIDLDAAQDAAKSSVKAKENEALRPLLDSLQAKLKGLEEKNKQLRDEHKELDDEHTQVLNEVNELMAVNQELREEIQTLRDDGAGASGTEAVRGLGGLESLSSGAIRQGELEDEVKNLKRDVNKFRTAEARAKNDLRQAQARERALAEEITELKQNVEDLVEEVDDLMALNQELRDKTDALEANSGETEPVGLLGKSGAAGVRNELDKMDLGEARKEIEQLKKLLTTKEDELAQVQAAVKKATSERDEALKAEQESSKEVDVLMGFMSELNVELKNLKQQRASTGEDIKNVTNLLGVGANVHEAAVKEELESLQLQLNSMGKKVDELQTGNDKLKDERDDALKKYNKAKEDQARQFIGLEDEIELLTEENEELVEFLKKVNGDLEKTKEEKDILEQKLAALELDAPPSENSEEDHKRASLKSTMIVLADSLREDLKTKEQEKRELQAQVDEANRKLKETEHQLKAATHSSTRVKLDLEKERMAHEKTKKKLSHIPDDDERARGRGLLLAPPPKAVPLASGDSKPVDMASFFARLQQGGVPK